MISGELLKIDNETVPSCRSYEVGYEKVWKDRSRNMAGDARSTLLGINIVLSVEFGGELLQSDVTNLLPKLEQDYFSVTFYDPSSDSTKTATYYVDSYNVRLLSKYKGRFEPIQIEFQPVSRSL